MIFFFFFTVALMNHILGVIKANISDGRQGLNLAREVWKKIRAKCRQ